MEREGKGGEGGEEGGGREGEGGAGKAAVLALSSRQWWHVAAAAPHNGPKTHSARGAAVCRPARNTSGYSTFFSRYKLHR